MNKKKKKNDADITIEEDTEESASQKKVKKSKDALKICLEEKKQYLDGWQYEKANFINYKNGEAERLQYAIDHTSKELIQEILPVLDSFHLALSQGLSKEMEQGVLLIRTQLEDVLKKKGLESIAIKPGDIFNPEMHESIGIVESKEEEGTIAEVIQRGYQFDGYLLRAAMVRLSNGEKKT